MAVTYHIRIKKAYAASLIEDLRNMDAIDVIKETNDDVLADTHMSEVQRRIKKYQDQSELWVDEQQVFRMLDAE